MAKYIGNYKLAESNYNGDVSEFIQEYENTTTKFVVNINDPSFVKPSSYDSYYWSWINPSVESNLTKYNFKEWDLNDKWKLVVMVGFHNYRSTTRCQYRVYPFICKYDYDYRNNWYSDGVAAGGSGDTIILSNPNIMVERFVKDNSNPNNDYTSPTSTEVIAMPIFIGHLDYFHYYTTYTTKTSYHNGKHLVISKTWYDSNTYLNKLTNHCFNKTQSENFTLNNYADEDEIEYPSDDLTTIKVGSGSAHSASLLPGFSITIVGTAESGIGGGGYETYYNGSTETNYMVKKSLYDEFMADVTPTPGGGGGGGSEPTHPFPVNTDGENEGGGGTGVIESSSQESDDLTTFSYSGYVTALTPTGVQMGNIMNYLLGNLNDRGEYWDEIINVLKNTYGNPMDYIVGCHVLPISIPSSSVVQMIVNNVQTLIISNKADDTYFRLSPEDSGSHKIPKLHIPKPSGSFLDYSPYMDISIFIPFIGFQNLKPEDVVDKWIGLYYYIDITNGNFSVRIRVDEKENDTEGKFLYHYSGNFAQTLPLTGNSYNNLMVATSNLAGSIAMSPASNIPGAVIGLAQNTIPQVQRTGGVGGEGSLLTYKRPYVYITYPDYLDPSNTIGDETTYRSSLQGNETYFIDRLKNITGYTVVKDIHLDNVNALDNELDEIETLLKEGVIL